MILWHSGLSMVILWFVLRGNPRVDYRFAFLGALLPDLIDKPVGRLLFRDHFESGRLIGHTLLFNVALLSVLFFMRGKLKRKLVLVPVASLLHLAQDSVWETPEVFWWPLFGTAFPRDPVTDGVFGFLVEPLRSPTVLLQEAVGGVLLLWLFAAHGMLSKEGLKTFLSSGQLEGKAA